MSHSITAHIFAIVDNSCLSLAFFRWCSYAGCIRQISAKTLHLYFTASKTRYLSQPRVVAQSIPLCGSSLAPCIEPYRILQLLDRYAVMGQMDSTRLREVCSTAGRLKLSVIHVQRIWEFAESLSGMVKLFLESMKKYKFVVKHNCTKDKGDLRQSLKPCVKRALSLIGQMNMQPDFTASIEPSRNVIVMAMSERLWLATQSPIRAGFASSMRDCPDG